MPNTLKRVSPVDCTDCERRGIGMFCNFFPKTLVDFSAIGRLISLSASAVLMREGYPCDQIYVVCTGQIKAPCSSKDGRTLNLKIAKPGEVLGLGAAIAGSHYELTAETLTPSVVKVVQRDEFLRFLQSHSEACWNATHSLAAEYKTALTGARNLALSGSVAGRVARLLLDLAECSTEGTQSLRFNLSLTHDDLAEFTSTSRETVTRTLGRFQKDKLIQIHGASVQILMPQRLAELAA